MIEEPRIRTARMIGAGVALGAVVLAVLPFLTQCAEGVALASGATVPMKCHWTAMAAIATAIPLAIVGVAAFFSRRAETLRVLGVLTAALGGIAMALPTALIGVCANPSHMCNYVMRPSMILIGLAVIVAGLAMAFLTRREVRSIA